MQIGVADARARDPNQNLARILDSRGFDINDFERLVVREKPSRLHATSYRAHSIWPLLRTQSRDANGIGFGSGGPVSGTIDGRLWDHVKYRGAIPSLAVEPVRRQRARLPRIAAVVCVAIFVIFVFSSSRSFAATGHDVDVGGVTVGVPLAPGGGVWVK